MFALYEKIKLFLPLLGLFVVPIVVFAQIVPCSGADCEICHIFELFSNLTNFVLFTVVPPIAVLVLVSGGLMLYFSAGNPKKMEKAKSLIWSTLAGILIIYFAGLIVGLVFVATGAADWERWWWGSAC